MIKINAAGRDRQNPEILIATLGVEPQVVTITLDRLRAGGRAVSEVTVVYTENPAVQKAMDMVAGEFISRFYPGIQLRPVPVTSGQEKIRDFCNNADLQALLRTLYGEVRRARQQGFIVHLCVSGGRKVMGIMAKVFIFVAGQEVAVAKPMEFSVNARAKRESKLSLPVWGDGVRMYQAFYVLKALLLARSLTPGTLPLERLWIFTVAWPGAWGKSRVLGKLTSFTRFSIRSRCSAGIKRLRPSWS